MLEPVLVSDHLSWGSVGGQHLNDLLPLPYTEEALGQVVARLAEGTYLAIQIPEKMRTVWDWRDWVYDPNTGQVVEGDDPTRLIPYNYIAFSVTKYEGEG